LLTQPRSRPAASATSAAASATGFSAELPITHLSRLAAGWSGTQSRAARSISMMTTVHSPSARRSEIARPIPRPPPVTTQDSLTRRPGPAARSRSSSCRLDTPRGRFDAPVTPSRPPLTYQAGYVELAGRETRR
jgi:hypothetical protein